MAGQASIKVDSGTGSPVDFSVTTSAGNYRQAVTIGDPLTDANYASVGAQGLNVVGTMSISNSPTVVLGSGSNVVGTFSVAGTPTVVLGAGNNVVGTFQLTGTPTVSISGTPNVSVTNTPTVILGSGQALVGEVISFPGTSSVYDGSTSTTPGFGTIVFSGLGSNVALGTITSKRIRILAMNFIVGTATNIYITDGTGGTIWGNSTYTGQFSANSGIVLPFNQVGWFQTASGSPLIFNLSATSSVAGTFSYIPI